MVRGETTYGGERRELIDLLLARREEFVLKPGIGSKGEGVHIGRTTPQDAWERLVRTAAGESFLHHDQVLLRQPRPLRGHLVLIASKLSLWWNPAAPDQPDLFGSFVDLSPDFFRAIVERPVPVDLRVLRALRSPLALDIYCWLTYRASYLRQPTEIPWPALALQFGAAYAEPRKFRYSFLRQVKAVLRLYPAASVSEGKHGLVLSPASPHVPR